MKLTDEEYKIVQKLEEQAIDSTTYTVYCSFCNERTVEEEYPSSAAREAYDEGFTVISPFDDGANYVTCKECLDNEKWKEWI